MDLEAARRARRKRVKIEWDLLKAQSDEEACPPVWVDLSRETRDEVRRLLDDIGRETEQFVTEPDIRVALDRRARFDRDVRGRVERLNRNIRRLNLLAPLPRFQRKALDADELLRPLYRTPRPASQ